MLCVILFALHLHWAASVATVVVELPVEVEEHWVEAGHGGEHTQEEEAEETWFYRTVTGEVVQLLGYLTPFEEDRVVVLGFRAQEPFLFGAHEEGHDAEEHGSILAYMSVALLDEQHEEEHGAHEEDEASIYECANFLLEAFEHFQEEAVKEQLMLEHGLIESVNATHSEDAHWEQLGNLTQDLFVLAAPTIVSVLQPQYRLYASNMTLFHCADRVSTSPCAVKRQPATALTWFYAMLGVLMSSVVSLVGGLLLVCKSALLLDHLQELLALSCGTLLGTVVFTLLPEVGELSGGFDAVMSTVLLAGVLFGFFSERVLHAHAHHTGKEHGHGHGHGHGDGHGHGHGHKHGQERQASRGSAHTVKGPSDDSCVVELAAARGSAMCVVQTLEAGCGVVEGEKSQSTREESAKTDEPEGSAKAEEGDKEETVASSQAKAETKADPEAKKGASADSSEVLSVSMESSERQPVKQRTAEMRSMALLNIVSDGLHNLVDGLLIGATFSVNPATGFVTALAIALHELPQELGDFVMMLKSGFSAKTALLFNFLVSLTAVLGCVIGLSVGHTVEDFSLYSLAFAAGLFLYLALAVLVPALHTPNMTHMQQIRIVVPFIIGISIMALLLLLPHGDHGEEAGDAAVDDGHGH